ncbi:hypothetical protein SDC9_58711 [bioreactor metagenome]|uniref:Uncharacterized protein n=1 Tax=bioreactor metagenome TaxID=1076179 RepID=A0A644X930_9ZZZZ
MVPGEEILPRRGVLDLHRKDGLLADIRLEGVKRHPRPVVAEGPFIVRAKLGIAQGIGDGDRGNHLVDADGLRYVGEVAHDNHGNAAALDFLCDR